MKYQDALDYIKETNKLGSRFGLESITRLLDLLDNPQKDLKVIHIGGTNGKGSTSSYLNNILVNGGYRVGLFTSPYMDKVNESIKLNGVDISDEDFTRIFSLIVDKIQVMKEEETGTPTTFDILTSLGFMFFKEKEIDYLILEVGLGGRKDSTNIISSPLASVFTTIDYDHVDVLGTSIEEIALEKSGIIKDNSLVISYPQKKSVEDILAGEAKEKNAEFYRCPLENLVIREISSRGSVFDFSYGGNFMEAIEISMIGEYQIYNAALALTTVLVLREKHGLQIADNMIRRGLKESKWPGRLELIREKPAILLDGAHNLQGTIQLKKALGLFDYRRLILCIAILKDKDVEHMIEEIAPLADEIIVTEVDMSRKLEAEVLAMEVSKYNKSVTVEKDLQRAIGASLEKTKEGDMLVFGGSLYLIGQVRKILKSQ
ncbi:MAG: folylpolyglutamate synthase/dihydrofolate synthase family protein [Tissierellaceae bacterium]